MKILFSYNEELQHDRVGDNMNELLLKAVDKLEIYQLVDIYEINNLKIQGFRVRGASSVAKTQRMKANLKNDPKLDEVLKKTAEYYREKKGKDFSWALISKLDIEMVKTKIKEIGIGEVILALRDAEKLETLEPFLVNDKPLSKDGIEKENGSEIVKVDNNVKELREIINNYEINNHKLKSNLEIKNEELKKANDEIKILNLKFKKAELKYEKIDKTLKENISLLILKEHKLSDLEHQLENLVEENLKITKELESISRKKILFLGTKHYRKYIDIKVMSNRNIKYLYLSDITGLSDYRMYEKVILLAFTMNKSEVQVILNKEEVKLFEELHNLILIDSLEYLNEYINKVGQFYE